MITSELLNEDTHQVTPRRPLWFVLVMIGLVLGAVAVLGGFSLVPDPEPAGHERPLAGAQPSDAGPVPTKVHRPADPDAQRTTGTRTDTTGWPGPSNTGVPAGRALTPMGGMSITRDGTVIDGADITGCVTVKASNVTIRNSRIRGACAVGTVRTDLYGLTLNTRLENVEVDGQRRAPTWPLIVGSNFTCLRCNLHSGGSQLHFTDNVTVLSSWLHDPYQAGTSQNSAMASHGGGGSVIRGNTLDCGTAENCSAALALYGNFGPIHDVLIEGNLLSGGAYCMYAGSLPTRPFPVATNVRVVGNAFARAPYARCGFNGAATAWVRDGGNEWRGNYWNEPGRPPVPDPVAEAAQRRR